MRILLVASDTQLIASLKPLVGWGHRVWVCATESQARAKVKEDGIDLVLADVPAPDWVQALGQEAERPPTLGFIGAEGGVTLPRPPAEEDLRRFVREVASRVEPVPLNREAAMVICDNDEELLADIIEVFTGDAPLQLEKIRGGFADNDLEAVRRAAHSIKGASANIAAEPLRDAAQHLEWAGKRQAAPAARASFAEVQYQWLRLQKYLHRFPAGSG